MLAAGQTVSHYRIVRQLGSGGMGVVYEAEEITSRARVALKVIHRDLASNHEVVTRFFNEAQAVNAIGSEHVVPVSELGQTDEGEYFLVLDMLEGVRLADVLAKERRLPVLRALGIAAQVASGLGAAHAAGVVHRDLKPDNVFLVARTDGVDSVKILDFGLARLTAQTGTRVTKRGVILGTPEYMCPEQAESSATVDHRGDIWSLGILLYQMTTGLLPFVGANMGEVVVKVVSRAAAPPRGINPAIPLSVEVIILRCLRKVPEARFQTMAELREALLAPDAWLAAHPEATIAPPIIAGPSIPVLRPSGPMRAPAQKTLIGVGDFSGATTQKVAPLPPHIRPAAPEIVASGTSQVHGPAPASPGRGRLIVIAGGVAVGIVAAVILALTR
jgi:serine/threonine-protein kinase